MKVEETAVATFNVGLKETAVAQIQASAKAFEILSSGLYSDAEFAIVREIGANAKDSHKAAGCVDRPFRVQIPTGLDPRFCVRDYGTSMSHQFMMTRVNTYFDSTKNDSNDEIGGFGLGIKSVFSYTTSFMIACFQGGKRRVYVYQIGSEGLPEISLMAESDTTEEDGVEVSIPVMEADYQKFANAVKKTFAFYEVKPEVTGMSLEIPEFQKVAQGTGWFVCQEHTVFNRDVYVEMGGIAYPVEDTLHDLSHYSRTQTLFLSAGIGDIDITPNREQVKMTPKTTQFVKDAIKRVGQEIQDVVQATVDAAAPASYWDMIEIANRFSNQMFNKLGYDRTRIKFNGVFYPESQFNVMVMEKPRPVDINDPSQGMTTPTITNSMVDGIEHFGYWELKVGNYGAGPGRVKRNDDSWKSTRHANFDRFSKPNTIVVLERKFNHHASRWMRATHISRITVITVADGTAASVVAKVKELLHGFTEVFNAADLTYDKEVISRAGGEKKFYIYSSGRYDSVDRKEVDYNSLPETMYYVPTDGRQKGELFGKTCDFKYEGKFITTAREWINGEVYYLTDALIAKINKHRPDVVLELLETVIEEKLEEKVRAAGENYFIKDMDSLQKPFAKVANSWRVSSALEFWCKKFNLSDLTDARKVLEDHKADVALERMCFLVRKKTITDLFVEYGIEAKEVSCPNLDAILEKIPYAFAFVDCYSDATVLEHIATQMGWTIDAAVEVDDEDDY